MKIQKIKMNNKKKCFEMSTSKHSYLVFPYSKLRLKPALDNPIEYVYIDPELAREAFTYHLKSGKEDSVPLDSVLEYNKDPDYLRDMMLYRLSVRAQEIIKAKKLSKREIIRRLHTSPTQFYRLIDQTNYSKTIDQMIKLLWALDTPVDIIIKKAA